MRVQTRFMVRKLLNWVLTYVNQKFIRPGEAQNGFVHQIWAKPDQQFVCKCMETAWPTRGQKTMGIPWILGHHGRQQLYISLQHLKTRATLNAEIPSAAWININAKCWDCKTVGPWNSIGIKYLQRMETLKQSDLWSGLDAHASLVVIWWLMYFQ